MLSFPITLYSFICLETPKEGLVSEPSVAVLTGIQLIVHQLVIYIIVGMRKWACAMPRIELGLQSCSAWHICLSSRIISAFLLEGSFHLAWWLYHLYSHLYSEVKHHVFIQISFCLTAEMNRIGFFFLRKFCKISEEQNVSELLALWMRLASHVMPWLESAQYWTAWGSPRECKITDTTLSLC